MNSNMTRIQVIRGFGLHVPQRRLPVQSSLAIQSETTIAAADQSSSPRIIDINGGIESSILESLQCIICLDVCVSPIYACTENGHLTCGSCHNKATQLLTPRQQHVKCSFCIVSLAVNTFADRLSRKWEVKVPCPHADAGCRDVFPAATFLEHEHIKDCEYRPIKCCTAGTSMSSCNHPIPMELFENHLIRIHKRINYSGGPLQLAFAVKRLFTKGDPESYSYWNGVHNWGATNIIQFDGRAFIVNTRVQNKAMHWWVLLLGAEKNASQYICKTQLIPRMNRPGKIRALLKSTNVQTIPVLGYHNYEKFDEFCPYYASATAALVSAACIDNKRSKEETLFVFRISFELLKNRSNNGNGVSSAQHSILGKRKILQSTATISSTMVYEID